MIYKKEIQNIIFNVKEAYKNKLYLLSEKLLTDIIKNEHEYYKVYILFSYLMLLKNDDEDKLKLSIKYCSKTIKLNKYYMLSYIIRYKVCKKLLKIYKSKNKDTKTLEVLMNDDINYLNKISNNFIIKKHIKNFIKNPLSYYDKNTLLLKTSSDITRYIELFNKEKVKYDYIDIMENYNSFIEKNNYNYKAYNLRGFLKYNLKIYDEAMEDFNKSISINSSYAESYYNRAKLKYNLKIYNEALNDFIKAQKIFVRKKISSPLDIIKCDHYIAWCNHHLNRNDKVFLDIEVDEDINDFSEGYYNNDKLKFNNKNYKDALKNFYKVDENCKNYIKTEYYKKICINKIDNNIDTNLIINLLRLSNIYKNENDFNITLKLCNGALEYIEAIKENDNDFLYCYLKGISLYELYDISFLNYQLKDEALYYLNQALNTSEEKIEYSKYSKRIKKIMTDITEYGI
ncbi:hypothetical protein [Brachyspira sp.]|uniref:tetratricopeptide repeat protein n=1 Tax=Brachyspira sp. TaxID=1977261 RepID=UPI002611CB87|nr:hypothetical protein [Brachyspira sp.]